MTCTAMLTLRVNGKRVAASTPLNEALPQAKITRVMGTTVSIVFDSWVAPLRSNNTPSSVSLRLGSC